METFYGLSFSLREWIPSLVFFPGQSNDLINNKAALLSFSLCVHGSSNFTSSETFLWLPLLDDLRLESVGGISEMSWRPVTERLLGVYVGDPSWDSYQWEIWRQKARLPMEGEGYQPTHKTFNLKCALLRRCEGIKIEQRWSWGNSKPMTAPTWNPSHVRESILDIINDTQLCLQTGT